MSRQPRQLHGPPRLARMHQDVDFEHEEENRKKPRPRCEQVGEADAGGEDQQRDGKGSPTAGRV